MRNYRYEDRGSTNAGPSAPPRPAPSYVPPPAHSARIASAPAPHIPSGPPPRPFYLPAAQSYGEGPSTSATPPPPLPTPPRPPASNDLPPSHSHPRPAAATAAAAGPSRCCFCHRPLAPGSRVLCSPSNGWPMFHSECFLCLCGQPILGPFMKKDGQPLHEACYAELYGTRCGVCRQIIQGQYLVFEGQPHHPACFQCSRCALPLQKYRRGSASGGADVLCEACCHATRAPAAALKSCTACARPIAGSYVTVGHRAFHPDCMKCAQCTRSIPTGELKLEGDRPYHTACHKAVHHPRCYVCEVYLPEERTAHGGSVIRFLREPEFPASMACAKHRTDGSLQCTGCLRYLPQASKVQFKSPEHCLCDDCVGIVVPDSEAAEPILTSIVEWYGRLGLRFPYVPPVLLVDLPSLERAASEGGSLERRAHVHGLCLTQINIEYETVGKLGSRVPHRLQRVGEFAVTAILALFGLPRPRLGAVLAHELMHCYLALAGYKQRVPGSLGASEAGWGLATEVEEGLCELMAWLWMMEDGRLPPIMAPDEHNNRLVAMHARRMLERKDLVYGDGFRAAHQAFSNVGLKVLLAHVMEHGSFPT